MKAQLHIIAACADRKRLPAPPERCLRSHRASGTRSRLASFVDALKGASGERLPARDLYVGSYWSAVRELPALAAERGMTGKLWVASAGYGLVPAEAELHGYSATFQLGADDSVAFADGGVTIRAQVAAWWSALSSWRGPNGREPRRLTDLARRHARASFLVIASPRYLQAMGPELVGVSELIGERLVIISSSEASAEPELAAHLVPSEAALLPVIGGALPALHARVAQDALRRSRGALEAGHLQAHYRNLVERSAYEGMPLRDAASDEEVQDFIRAQLKLRPQLHCTPALRAWREGGRACEQKRFKRLFQEVAHGQY